MAEVERPSVTKEEVRRIAALARLRLDDETVERLAADLTGILEHVGRLEEVDVSSVAEAHRPTEGAAPFRDPELEPDPMEEGEPARGAPAWRDGFFLVPRLPGVEGRQ